MHDPHQEFYDRLAAEWDLNFTAEDRERLSRRIDSFGVKPGMNTLDLGCGTGVLFDMLRRAVGETGSVTGVDFSFQMARMAHRNFPMSNVNVIDADAAALPFPDSLFDIGFSFNAFPHFRNKKATLDEAHRVLKHGAKFFVIHLVSSAELAELHKSVGGPLQFDELPNAQRMKDMLDASKFSDVKIEDHTGLYLASAVNIKE